MPKRTTIEASRPTALRMRLTGTLMIGFVFASAYVGCAQPRDEDPGYRLRGEPVDTRVDEWRFTKDVDEIFIQTTPWYLMPHSTTIWCVELNGELYIGSYGPDGKKRWERNVLRNPKAKLRIAGKLYDVMISEVDDDATARGLDLAYAKKYDMAEVFGEDVPEWWYYRVVQRD